MKNHINEIENALFLMEMAFINKSTTKEKFAKSTESLNGYIEKEHSTATPIGNDNYHNKIKGMNVYYHMHENKPREFSLIYNDNTQALTSKRDGDVKHIHEFLDHHIKTHGEVKSSADHSNGAVIFWKKYINTQGDKYKFSHHDKDGNKLHDIDKNTDLNSLWTTNLDHRNVLSHSYIKVSNDKT